MTRPRSLMFFDVLDLLDLISRKSAGCPISSVRAADGVHLHSCEWKTTALAKPLISDPSVSCSIPVTVIRSLHQSLDHLASISLLHPLATDINAASGTFESWSAFIRCACILSCFGGFFSSKPLLPSCCFTFLSDKEKQFRRCSH